MVLSMGEPLVFHHNPTKTTMNKSANDTGEKTIRQVLPNSTDFKQFWKDQGPFAYALTSAEFPPVLLDPEEWIFGNEIQRVLKELMQFDQRKMGFVSAPFNPKKKATLRPENMIPWKIKNFPGEWNSMECRAFVPEGHLTWAVLEEIDGLPDKDMNDSGKIQAAFFTLLEKDMERMGYVLLGPGQNAKTAAVREYLDEWEEDEKDAGII